MGQKINAKEVTTNREIFGAPDLDNTLKEIKGQKFMDYVNVKDYGAKGDGVTDDTEAIQNSLNNKNKNIFFPDGDYLINNSLLVNSNTKILFNKNARILINDELIDGFDVQEKENIIFENVNIKGISVSGSASGNVSAGINFYRSKNVKVINGVFDQMNLGIHSKQSENIFISNNVVKNMVVAENGVVGYGINTDGSKEVLAIGNKIYNCERHGFYLGASDEVNYRPQNQNIISNYIVYELGSTPSTYQGGIKLFSADYINIDKNKIIGTKQGLWVSKDTSHINFTNNTIKNTQEHSLLIYGGENIEPITHFLISGNNIIQDTPQTTYNAMHIASEPPKKFFTIENNYIKGFASGVNLADCENARIGINTFEDCNQAYFLSTNISLGSFKTPNLINTDIGTKNYSYNRFTDGDTTPSVKNSNIFETNNTSATTITDFDNGTLEQEITLFFLDSNTTIENNLNITTKSKSNLNPSQYDVLRFKRIKDTWYEI